LGNHVIYFNVQTYVPHVCSTVYTGDGFTVSDSYTCGSGDCGGFTIVDTYTHAVAGPVAAPSHALAAPVMAAMPEGKSTTVRATPAHFVSVCVCA